MRVSLGTLPADVIIPIAAFVVLQSVHISDTGPHGPALFELSAVCQHIRAALLSAPELWTHIDLVWTERYILECTSRAGAHPLHIRVSPRDTLTARTAMIFARAISLVLNFDESTFMEYEVPDMTLLRSLTLVCPTSLYNPGASRCLSAETYARLNHISCRGSMIITPFPLPALVYADLQAFNTTADILAQFFLCAPQIKDLALCAFTLYLDPWGLLVSASAPLLHRLQRLRIEGATHDVQTMLGMLRPPAVELHVVADGRSLSYEDARRDEVLAAYVAAFLAQHAPLTVPKGSLHVECTSSQPRMNVELGGAQLPLHYVQHDAVPLSSPLLAHVGTLILESESCPTAFLESVFAQVAQHPWLAGVDRLVLCGWRHGATAVADRQRLQPLEDWIASRPPLHIIKFEGCSGGMKPMFARLASAQSAEQVTWRWSSMEVTEKRSPGTT
jgi:hypothetical protein